MTNTLLRIGIIGELEVQQQLLNRNFNVFNNICDDDGIDLVCEKNNKFFKIQVKKATKISYYKTTPRYSFGLGNTKNRPDFFICVVNEGFLIIPSSWCTSQSFNWYPFSKKDNQKFILNNWNLLK